MALYFNKVTFEQVDRLKAVDRFDWTAVTLPRSQWGQPQNWLYQSQAGQMVRVR